MEKEKVTSKTSKEFIKEVAIDCVANMKEEDKEYIRKWNFVYVDESFHDDYELALIVISDNDQMNNVFRFLSDRLKNDISLALIDAAGEYPDVEEYSEQLRDSDEVAEKLIEVHGIDFWRFSKMSDRIKKKYGYKEK